jgi:serine/threonine protein kinase
MTRSNKDTTSDRPSAQPEQGGKIFRPGDLVAKRYRINRLIGEGGSGEVYAAADLALGEEVALKTLNPGEAQVALNLERFRREIHLSRKVTHPNVCRIFDLGEHEASGGRRTLFFTMELLSGSTLDARLDERRQMSTAEVLPIAEQIAAGLEAAHSSGVVHRDLKPGNIMLLRAGDRERVVITDFGLARSSEIGAIELTESGEMVGTPLYMSPEQVRGTRCTQATDIYSFAIVLYEMLSAELPFDDINPLATALKRLKSPPTPIRQHLPDLPASWEATIHRCLEPDPTARFQRATEVIAALRGEIAASAPSRRATIASLVKRTLRRTKTPHH